MQHLLSYFHAGGPLMWPLLACSLVVLLVTIERFVRLRRGVLLDAAAVADVRKLIEEGYPQRAAEKYREQPALVGRVLSLAIDDHLGTGLAIEKALIDHGRVALRPLLDYLSILSLIARVAPLLGLLGTVLGIIDGYEGLEKAGVGRERLAAGVRAALLATAAGLAVGILAAVALWFFRGRVRQIEAVFEEVFLKIARAVRAGPARPSATPTTLPLIEDGDHLVLPAALTENAGP
jgi:biopolymer transport protein ExbB